MFGSHSSSLAGGTSSRSKKSFELLRRLEVDEKAEGLLQGIVKATWGRSALIDELVSACGDNQVEEFLRSKIEETETKSENWMSTRFWAGECSITIRRWRVLLEWGGMMGRRTVTIYAEACAMFSAFIYDADFQDVSCQFH